MEEEHLHYYTSNEFNAIRLELGLNMEYDQSFVAKKQYAIKQNILENIKDNSKNFILKELLELYGEKLYNFNSEVIAIVGELVFARFVNNEKDLYTIPLTMDYYKNDLTDFLKNKSINTTLIFIYLQNIIHAYNMRVNGY